MNGRVSKYYFHPVTFSQLVLNYHQNVCKQTFTKVIFSVMLDICKKKKKRKVRIRLQSCSKLKVSVLTNTLGAKRTTSRPLNTAAVHLLSSWAEALTAHLNERRWWTIIALISAELLLLLSCCDKMGYSEITSKCQMSPVQRGRMVYSTPDNNLMDVFNSVCKTIFLKCVQRIKHPSYFYNLKAAAGKTHCVFCLWSV